MVNTENFNFTDNINFDLDDLVSGINNILSKIDKLLDGINDTKTNYKYDLNKVLLNEVKPLYKYETIAPKQCTLSNQIGSIAFWYRRNITKPN